MNFADIARGCARKGLLDTACRMTDFGRRVIDYYAPHSSGESP